MNKKLIEPSTKAYLLILTIFAVATFFFNERLAMVEGGIVVVLVIVSAIVSRRRKKEMIKYIEDLTYNTESAKNNTLMNFPLPIVVFKMEDYRIVWGNQKFFDLFGVSRPTLDARLTAMVPSFGSKWLMEGKSMFPELIVVGGRKYQLHGNIISGKKDDVSQATGFMGITYWVDVTEFDDIKQEYANSRPVAVIGVIDNYDELTKGVADRVRIDMRGKLDEILGQWCEERRGFICRVDRDRYIFIFEARYLDELKKNKFAILENVTNVVSPTGIHATISIGVGVDGETITDCFTYANLAIDMALSRGGDQAVIKNRHTFDFYGGRGNEVETRTRVRSRVTANAVSGLITSSSMVMLMGHKQGDLDCIGAAAGMACACRKLGKPFKIVVDPVNNVSHRLIERLKIDPVFANAFITPDEAIVKADSKTLLIVVDTDRPERVESQSLLEACNKVVVIDHHRRAATAIQNAAFSFTEAKASSACELVCEILQEIVEPVDISRAEAEALLSGIVLDTKNFTMRTAERTFDAAAFLNRVGADTSRVKKLLQNNMSQTVARCNVLQTSEIYRNGIAIAVQEDYTDRVVAAQAADELLNVSGVEASVVICKTPDDKTTVSARSIGDVNVQILLERLGGGGNKSAAGLQRGDMSVSEMAEAVRNAINEYFDK